MFFKKKAINKILEFARTQEQIDVQSGKCRWNLRCHMNAVHEAIENKQSEIAMCITVNKKDEYPFIHFVNVESDGTYTDNTLGHWKNTYDYYLIEKIPEKDFYDIVKIFVDYREVLSKKLDFFTRIFNKNNF